MANVGENTDPMCSHCCPQPAGGQQEPAPAGQHPAEPDAEEDPLMEELIAVRAAGGATIYALPILAVFYR